MLSDSCCSFWQLCSCHVWEFFCILLLGLQSDVKCQLLDISFTIPAVWFCYYFFTKFCNVFVICLLIVVILIFQDILRLLTLWFNHGATAEVQMALQQGFSLVNINTWLVVLPQIIARIHSNNHAVRELIQSLLVRIGQSHPQVCIGNSINVFILVKFTTFFILLISLKLVCFVQLSYYIWTILLGSSMMFISFSAMFLLEGIGVNNLYISTMWFLERVCRNWERKN